MHRLLQQFSDRLHAAVTESELKDSVTSVARELNFANFAYLSLARDAMGRPQVITTYPGGWAARYLGQAYQKIDPVVHQALERTGPFSWGTPETLGPLAKPQLQFFDEASEFGIRCGFTVPFHDSAGRLSAMTYASESRPEIFKRDLRRSRDALHLMAMYFHIHVREKLGKSASETAAGLSPRECQCLRWSARGKTQWEIARILGISRRTVAFHLDNARAKLDSVTVTQAVAKAVREGLILPE